MLLEILKRKKGFKYAAREFLKYTSKKYFCYIVTSFLSDLVSILGSGKNRVSRSSTIKYIL